ncbi:MAG: phosphate/phosphite/phosphonate ABC transporter substrate-binding protein [Candidatus Ozemobacteraceae bacterium]
MPTKSATRWFRPFFLITSLCLAVLISVPTPRVYASKEEPTINELMQSGELDKELADERPVPASPDSSSPATEEEKSSSLKALSEEDQAPVAPPPPTVASQELVPVPNIELAKKVVMIGRVPFMNVKNMMVHYQGLIQFLRKEMGVKDVCIVTGKDYAGVVNALARGTIDFAWLGPMAYVIGNEQLPLVPLAQAKRRSGATYRGVFITRKDSKILGIEDIKDKVIGFVDPESASGYLYPLYFLNASKINPHKYCRKVEFLKKHDDVLIAVFSRKIDVGVCLEDTFLAVKDKKILDQFLVLGKTYEVPSDVVACREDCHPTLRDKFQKALLKTRSLKQTVNPATGLPPILEFVPVDETSLESARGILNAINNVRQR